MLRVLSFALSTFFVACTCNSETGITPLAPPADPEVQDFADPVKVGRYLSLDASNDGTQLTMAFYDPDLGGLGYAVGLPNEDLTVSWAYERADGYPDPTNGLDSIDTGFYASQRTAPDGTVWVAHQETTGNLRVSQRAAANDWSTTRVEPGGNYASLDVRPDGWPVVAHITENAEVKVARFDGSSWSSEVIYTGQPEGELPAGVSHTRVFVDGETTFVAFRDDALQNLQLAELTDGAATVVNAVDSRGDTGAWPSLGKINREMVIAYHMVGRQDLMVGVRNNNDFQWSRQVADGADLRGADNEIFEIDGTIAVVYFDGTNNDVMLARAVNGGWQVEAVGTDGALGYFNEVAFAAGHWWVGSFDLQSQSLFIKAL